MEAEASLLSGVASRPRREPCFTGEPASTRVLTSGSALENQHTPALHDIECLSTRLHSFLPPSMHSIEACIRLHAEQAAQTDMQD